MTTVAQIRAAIEGLPDDAPALLHVHFMDEMDSEIYVQLIGFKQDEGSAIVLLVAEVESDDPAENDEDDEDYPEGSWDGDE